MFFNEVRIFRFYLNSYITFTFTFIVYHIDRPPLRALVGFMSRFTTLVILANPRLGVRTVFAFCDLVVVVGVNVEALVFGCTIS